ncbi:MAG: hypothetical protein KU38_06165 [Sulfurovum sp. FS08-3]|nr:MAG: hypothetical protein KU38_06165 [Sulfurovum sp. FS08-3]
MTKNQIFNKIKQLKTILIKEGFVIDGIFGSYARGDYTDKSDVDILYHLEEPFFGKYTGFVGFSKLDEIKEMISKEIHKDVDIASKNGLSKTGEKYILSEVVYV